MVDHGLKLVKQCKRMHMLEGMTLWKIFIMVAACQLMSQMCLEIV